jgi:hypothetical protein
MMTILPVYMKHVLESMEGVDLDTDHFIHIMRLNQISYRAVP